MIIINNTYIFPLLRHHTLFNDVIVLCVYLFMCCCCCLFFIKMGDLQTSYNSLKRSLDMFSNHAESKTLLKTLEQHFAMI